MDDEDGRAVGLGAELWFCEVEYGARSNVGSIRDVLSHGNLPLRLSWRQDGCQQHQACHQSFHVLFCFCYFNCQRGLDVLEILVGQQLPVRYCRYVVQAPGRAEVVGVRLALVLPDDADGMAGLAAEFDGLVGPVGEEGADEYLRLVYVRIVRGIGIQHVLPVCYEMVAAMQDYTGGQ